MIINTNDIIFWVGVTFGVVGCLVVVLLAIVAYCLFCTIKNK